METEIITGVIANLGFPIFVSLYFMFRFEKILKSNTDALHALLKKIK